MSRQLLVFALLFFTYQVNGSSIMSKSIVPNTIISLNTENYAAGTYLLTLRSRDGTVSTMRVVKINH